ncbi:MAG: hypothetical protein AAB431_02055, partial [Patescibacteria group bacterium]
KEDDLKANANDPKIETTKVLITHPPFISNASGGHDYYPVLTHGLKSNYQICMYPSMMDPALPGAGACNGSNTNAAYCCNGQASSMPCTTAGANKPLPGNK